MVDAAKYQTLERFSGISNVDDTTRMPPLSVNHEYVYPLQQAANVYIDNTYGIHSRPGYDEVISGTDIHSLFSDNEVCLFVDGGTLKELGKGYSTISLETGLFLKARMSYAPWNDRVYYTNYFQIGYVKNQKSYPLADPSREFKAPLPAGQFIAYYRARLYVARDNVLYISDPLCDYYDIRNGYKLFSDRITMVRPVDDGIYVGDGKVYWLKGAAPEDFDRDEVFPMATIPYTDVNVNGRYIGEGIKGNVAMWTGLNGICLGDNTGTVVNLTEGRYTFSGSGEGAAFIRDNGNIRHYINSMY